MRRAAFRFVRTAIIWFVSLAAVLAVSWFAPSLANASINILFRLRGELSQPAEDIVIVAIDDASLQRLGKYPWSRQITADCLNVITGGKPKAVGLDIIYAEETTPEEDEQLAAAIEKNGRVVLPVQLFENASENDPAQTEIQWLNPLSEFDRVAAGKGHAHAAPDVDGTLRSIQLSKADDKGERRWAFGLEALRVAEQIPAEDYQEKSGALHFGSYKINLETEAATVPGVTVVRTDEMLINYAGPTKSFRYYSFADVLEGRIAPDVFAGKIVLVGATSPTLGDSQVTPFMHYSSPGDDREGGQAMPGVEVHANVVNTIKNHLSLRYLPQFGDIGIALLIIFAATAAVKFLDGWRQVMVLAVIFVTVVFGSLFAFDNYFLILPVPEMLTAFLAVVPLLLLDRSLAASRDLDVKLNTLSEVQKGFLPDEGVSDKSIRQKLNLGSIVSHNLEWKLRAVDDITTRLLSRMSFIDRVLTGMTEGVLVADIAGRVVFVNEHFSQMFDLAPPKIINQNLNAFFAAREFFDSAELGEAIDKVLEGNSYEKEFETPAPDARSFFVRLSPVTPGNDRSAADAKGISEIAAADDFSPAAVAVIGILILISDVTKQREFDRLKAETMRLVSHELRAPLTSIQGLSDVLRKFPVSGKDSGEMLSTIHSEAVRLNELINRFLDLERLESGAQDLQKSAVEINRLVASCVQGVMPLANEKDIKIRQINGHLLPSVQADSQLLAQAVRNLLHNALKYSPPETTVTIETVRAATELQIIVRDEGYGIPEPALERIFDKFYRLERDAASTIIGSGLGLAFVKEVAEKHGGRVFVESEEGTGSTFILSIPF